MIDAAKRASAYKIIAVMPYFGWARQDRKDKPRVAIGAKLVADMLSTAGIDRLITMDLHADQIQGFFNVPVDHLYSSSVFIPYIQNNLKMEALTVASPDVGGSKRANAYAKYLGCPMVLCHKSREKANVVSEMTVIGDVKGRNVIILDDMVDTAGTLTKAADLMSNAGAASSSGRRHHPVMSDPASQRVEDSSLAEIYFTDSIPFSKPCKRHTSFPLPTCLPTLFVVSIRISQSARIIWYKFSSHHIEEAASPLMQPLLCLKYK